MPAGRPPSPGPAAIRSGAVESWRRRAVPHCWVVAVAAVATLVACFWPSARSVEPGTLALGVRAAMPGGLAVAQIARRYPGLTPFAPAPASPAVKPVDTSGPVPVVISRIPTTDKIVFVTIDDGWEKDPQLIRLLADLRVPVTMFLAHDAIKNDLGFFRQLQTLGDPVEDHTLTHPALSKISPTQRRAEICTQADLEEREFGRRPYLFRPPYGDPYVDPPHTAFKAAAARDIERTAAGCGIKAIVLWREWMQSQDLHYGPSATEEPDHRLHPGDIILAHFMRAGRVDETQRMINLFRLIQAQGFTVARLEDYV